MRCELTKTARSSCHLVPLDWTGQRKPNANTNASRAGRHNAQPYLPKLMVRNPSFQSRVVTERNIVFRSLTERSIVFRSLTERNIAFRSLTERSIVCRSPPPGLNTWISQDSPIPKQLPPIMTKFDHDSIMSHPLQRS